MKLTATPLICGVAALAATAAPLSAAYIDVSSFNLGTTSYDGWGKASEPTTTLTRANYPDYATSSGGVGTLPSYASPWAQPLGSNTAGSGDALFNKTSGSGAFAGAGLYQAGGTGSFSVSDSTALTGLSTVVFQMEVNYLDTGASFSDTAVSLVINGITYTPAFSTYFSQSAGDAAVLASNKIFAYQWDLTGVAGVSSFAVNWDGPSSSGQITSLQLTQGTTFTQVVPEPSAAFLGSIAAGLLVLRRRR
ncbi:MAG: hypothetical protein JWO82_3589 [Akkermansiaceae bacterium]|nr:hypothetical protein [Akkermansiaceae bacterium]